MQGMGNFSEIQPAVVVKMQYFLLPGGEPSLDHFPQHLVQPAPVGALFFLGQLGQHPIQGMVSILQRRYLLSKAVGMGAVVIMLQVFRYLQGVPVFQLQQLDAFLQPVFFPLGHTQDSHLTFFELLLQFLAPPFQ